MPSRPLEVHELSSELGRGRQESFCLRFVRLITFCLFLWCEIHEGQYTLLCILWKITTGLFIFPHFSHLSTGGCFPRCASKCAIWTRASSITSQWTSCPWTLNATGVCLRVHARVKWFRLSQLYSFVYLLKCIKLLAGMCITARSGWWLGTRTTPASLHGFTCTQTRRVQGRPGCVRSSALTGSNSPTTRWTIRDM